MTAAIVSGVMAYRLTGVFPDWYRMARITAVALVTGAVLFGLKTIGAPWLLVAVVGPVVYGLLLVATRSVDLGYLKSAIENDGADQETVDPVVSA